MRTREWEKETRAADILRSVENNKTISLLFNAFQIRPKGKKCSHYVRGSLVFVLGSIRVFIFIPFNKIERWFIREACTWRITEELGCCWICVWYTAVLAANKRTRIGWMEWMKSVRCTALNGRAARNRVKKCKYIRIQFGNGCCYSLQLVGFYVVQNKRRPEILFKSWQFQLARASLYWITLKSLLFLGIWDVDVKSTFLSLFLSRIFK